MGSRGPALGQWGIPAVVSVGMAWAGGLDAQVATTHTHTFSGAAGEGKRLAGAREPLDDAEPQASRGATTVGRQFLSHAAGSSLPFPAGEADLASAAFWGRTGSDVGHCGPHGCAQLCPKGRWAGEVKGAGQMLVQLLCRGDRWDKRSWVLQGPVN